MNDDLLKKEATTDSRSETFSSIMKVREKREREREREETEEGGVGKRKRREGDRGERRREERGRGREESSLFLSFSSSHCVTYVQSFLVAMTLRHFVSK